MSDFIFSDADERVFLLNNIELLSAIFRGPDSDAWAAIIETGLPELSAHAPKQAGDITRSLQKLQDSLPASTGISDLETEYVRLFVAGRGGIVAPLYESCHLGDSSQVMGTAALAMQSRLKDCGLEVSLDSNEPPDHIALELEYLYHLLVTGWSEENPELEAKARTFVSQIMLPWVRRFCAALHQGTPHPTYSFSADHAVTVLERVSG